MSEKVLGIVKVARPYWGWNIFEWSSFIHEQLVFTSDRVLVIRKWSEYMGGGVGATDVIDGLTGVAFDAIKTSESKRRMLERERHVRTLEELLRADKHNFAIPNSEIRKIELKSRFRFHITTNKEKHKWYASPHPYSTTEKGKEIKYPADYENMLRPTFGDKLSVKK